MGPISHPASNEGSVGDFPGSECFIPPATHREAHDR